MRRARPTYDLRHIQTLVARGAPWCLVTLEAQSNGARLRFAELDILETVMALHPTDFYKSMEAERRPGLWQDVYHTRRRGVPLYVKLQIAWDGRAVIVQFKRR